MPAKGFEQNGTIYVKNHPQAQTEAMAYYQRIFDMEIVEHHMDLKLKINGHLFFEIYEVSDERYDAYMKTITTDAETYKKTVLSSSAYYETEAELRAAYDLLAAEAIWTGSFITLPWSPCSVTLVDKYGVSWGLSTLEHMPCSDCTKMTCEGDWNGKCRLNKWTVELYREHGADWFKHIE